MTLNESCGPNSMEPLPKKQRPMIPQPQYLITEEELQDLYVMTHRDYEQQATEIHQRVHTRPHQPAAPETLYTADMVKNRIEKVKRDTRNETLVEVISALKKVDRDGFANMPRAIRTVESIRISTSTKEQQR